MRYHREIEKQSISSDGKMDTRLAAEQKRIADDGMNNAEPDSSGTDKEIIAEKSTTLDRISRISSFEEAMELFEE